MRDTRYGIDRRSSSGLISRFGALFFRPRITRIDARISQIINNFNFLVTFVSSRSEAFACVIPGRINKEKKLFDEVEDLVLL